MGWNAGWLFFGMEAYYLVVLDTKGDTYKQLEIMFQKKFSAKEFPSYVPNGTNDLKKGTFLP